MKRYLQFLDNMTIIYCHNMMCVLSIDCLFLHDGHELSSFYFDTFYLTSLHLSCGGWQTTDHSNPIFELVIFYIFTIMAFAYVSIFGLNIRT